MWKLLLSVSVCISLAMSLVFCLCWKKKTPKDEWLGVDGMVTQKNPDENVNHLPSAATCVDGVSNGELIDNKRNTITNTRRSLPDIPSEMVAAVNWEPNGDNSSEHYATLGQYQNAGKKTLVANGPEARPSISQHSSISQADDAFSPYERVKYDKIKSKEHPYAQVQPNSSRPVAFKENPIAEERATLLRVDVPSTSTEPTAPIRSRRSSAQSGCGMDIPAATAVAGGIAASYDLPYMTPPVTQANFSGDSQDSSSYTSISVREPLANILAQTKEMNKKKRSLDVHYSTVSDDSDDVYTTIPDPNNQIYTSESETYARIPPLPVTVEAEINFQPSERDSSEREEDDDDELYEPPPQPTPPIESLKHVSSHTHTHSRQASSSSSITNIGSPKPEKRQANSPLPPPPATTSNFDFHADKVQVIRNLDDLYAKVHKNKKEDISEDRLSGKGSLNESLRNSLILTKGLVNENTPEKRQEHSYETLRQKLRNTSDPGYEKIKDGLDCEPGYASINGPESLASSSDPGYEVLRNRVPSEIDPNYEQLRHRNSNTSDTGYSKAQEKINDGYSIVNKKKKLEFPKNALNTLEDPNYESMSSEISEPNYAAVKSNGSDTDPNYESVSQSDPNYESVKDLKPPYEKLDEDSSRTNSEISGYEKIKSNISTDSSNSVSRTTESEPPYERLHNDIDSDIPGYEKIGKCKEGNSSGSSGNEIGPIQNEIVESEISAYIHEEDAVVQV